MSLELRAGLLMAKKLNEDAKKLYAQAAREEKALGYREPPAYIRPVGETEAAAFLAAGIGPPPRPLITKRSSSDRVLVFRSMALR